MRSGLRVGFRKGRVASSDRERNEGWRYSGGAPLRAPVRRGSLPLSLLVSSPERYERDQPFRPELSLPTEGAEAPSSWRCRRGSRGQPCTIGVSRTRCREQRRESRPCVSGNTIQSMDIVFLRTSPRTPAVTRLLRAETPVPSPLVPNPADLTPPRGARTLPPLYLRHPRPDPRSRP